MPGEVHSCFLCGREKRAARSLFKVIKSHEQEQKIMAGYMKRYKISITGSLINQKIHRTCYESIVRNVSAVDILSLNSFQNSRSPEQTNLSHQNSDELLSSVMSDQCQIDEQENYFEFRNSNGSSISFRRKPLSDCSNMNDQNKEQFPLVSSIDKPNQGTHNSSRHDSIDSTDSIACCVSSNAEI